MAIKVSLDTSSPNTPPSVPRVAMTDAFQHAMQSALQGGGGVRDYYNGQLGRRDLLARIKAAGAAAFTEAGQPTGGCLQFANTAGWADVPADISHLSSDAATFEAWINTSATPDAFNGQVVYIGKDGDGASPRISVDASSRIKVYWSAAGSGGSHASSDTTSITDGTWHHIAVVVDHGTVSFYKDGRPTTEQSPVTMPAGQPAGAPCQIGAGFGDATGFVGQVFDLRLWNRARSGDQIRGLMHAAVDGSLTQQLNTLKQQGLLIAASFDAGRKAPVNLVTGATGDLHDCAVVVGPLPPPGYRVLRAALGDYGLEIRTHVDPAPPCGDGHAVTVPGSIAIFLDGPAGQQEITARKVKVAADEASEIAAAAAVIAKVFQAGLTRYFSTLAEAGGEEAADVAVETAAAAASEEIAGGIGLEIAFGALAVVEVIGLVVAVAAVAIIIIEAIFQRRAHQLTIFNTTDSDFAFHITYLYNSRPAGAVGGVLPPKTKASEESPFGAITYDLASKAVLFLQNEILAMGIGYVLNFQSNGAPPFAVLGDIPVSGPNSFLVEETWQGGEGYYDDVTGGSDWTRPNRALKQLRQQVQVGPRRLTLVNDQLTGNTSYGGYTGENYCSILYIE